MHSVCTIRSVLLHNIIAVNSSLKLLDDLSKFTYPPACSLSRWVLYSSRAGVGAVGRFHGVWFKLGLAGTAGAWFTLVRPVWKPELSCQRNFRA